LRIGILIEAIRWLKADTFVCRPARWTKLSVLVATSETARKEFCMSSNPASIPGDVFDVRKVRKFIELMNEHDLAEIDLRQGDQRIRLRRGPEAVTVAAMPAVSQGMVASAPSGGGGERKMGEKTADDSKANFIRSPMVGTFYSAANPESPPFVKVGDHVGPETTVCIVEAMKVFNEIPAECSGRIAAVMAQNGDAIEFNQPLFRVEPD
jgi:acetyl-CoA carboxylase biotin carboxyl carrier protein